MAGYWTFVQRFTIILMLLLPFVARGLQSELPAVLLDGMRSSYTVTEKLKLLEDKTNALSFDDILKNSLDFKPTTLKVVNVGPTNSTYWMKFKAVNQSSREWFLFIGAPFLKEVDLYEQLQNGTFRKTSVGSGRPFRQRYVLTTQMILPLSLAGNDSRLFYLRIKSNSIIRVPLEIATMQHIFEKNQTGDIANGFYFGLIAALIIYNIFVFISIRERTYLYYVFYILFVALNIGYIKGYFLQFITPNFPEANHSNYTGTLGFSFAVLFTNSFLNTALFCPKLRKVGWLIFASSAFSFGASLSGEYLLGFMINWITVGAFLVYSNLIGFKVLSKGFAPAKYYLMGFNTLLVGIVVFMMKDVALIPENWFTEGSYQIGSGLEAIILSFALANKLNIFKKEKELTQERALEQASLFSQQLIGSQESERKRVAAELHDSLGQSLGMVKNKVLMIKRDADKPLVHEKQLRDLEVMVAETIQEVRNISYNLRPLHLELLGITQSIHSLVEDIMDAGLLVIEADIQSIDNLLTKSNEMNVFRIIQECFNNIVKHSHATHAKILVHSQEKGIHIRIEDNGVGMSADIQPRGGFGMIGIRERLNILNGHLEILENVPMGTVMNIKIRL